MTITRNNLLFYFGDVGNVGGLGNFDASNGVLSRYAFLVVAAPTWANPMEVADVEQALEAYKASVPTGKSFGLTTWTDLLTWQAEVDAWLAEPQVSGLLAGIYVEKFATASRADQNIAVAYLHTNSLSAFVDPGVGESLFDVLGRRDADAAPALGRLTTQRDYVLIDGFGRLNQNSATPAAETDASQVGRIEYARGAATNVAVSPAVAFNIGLMLLMGAGTAASVNEADWLAALTRANAFAVESFGVAPFDRGASNGRYFEDWRTNTFRE